MNPVREIVNVFFRQRLCEAGHVACIIGALTRLEVFQLRDDVLRMLTRQTRDFVLTCHAAQMAHRTE